MPLVEEMDRFRSVAEFFEFFNQKIRLETGSEETKFYLRSPDGAFLEKVETRDVSTGISGDSHIPLEDNSFPGWSALHYEAFYVNDPQKDKRYNPDVDNVRGKPPHCVAACPIIQYGQVIGVALIADSPDGYGENKLNRIVHLLEEIPTFIKYLKMKEDIGNLTQKYGELAIQAVDVISPEGNGHVLRVAAICTGFASYLDLSEIVKQKLWQAAIYHDIGKLLMQGREPWEIERFHAKEGAKYLRSINVLRYVADLVEISHERFDGTGFPAGLSGEVAPIEAWALILAENLEEFNHENRSLFFEDLVAKFFARHAESHHPLAMEALAVLVDSGNLEKILRG